MIPPAGTSKKVLLIVAHPELEKSKINHALTEGVRDLPGVTIRNLFTLYPDFLIDVAAEQKLLLENDALVFQFPFYWYGTPALLKHWQDVVLTWNFAFGPEGTALRAKPFLAAVTTGSSDALYQSGGRNEYTVAEFLRPLQKTFEYCGMIYELPFVIHGANRISDEEIQTQIVHYRERIRALTSGEIVLL